MGKWRPLHKNNSFAVGLDCCVASEEASVAVVGRATKQDVAAVNIIKSELEAS